MGRLDDTSMTRVDEALQISFGLGMDKESTLREGLHRSLPEQTETKAGISENG